MGNDSDFATLLRGGLRAGIRKRSGLVEFLDDHSEGVQLKEVPTKIVYLTPRSTA